MNKIIPYNPKLVPYAKILRQNMTLGVRFSRQIPIDQYIVDFYCKNLQLAIEVDGSIHFKDEQQNKDIIRQNRLESLGVVLIRFNDLDVKNNLSLVLEELKNTIKK